MLLGISVFAIKLSAGVTATSNLGSTYSSTLNSTWALTPGRSGAAALSVHVPVNVPAMSLKELLEMVPNASVVRENLSSLRLAGVRICGRGAQGKKKKKKK